MNAVFCFVAGVQNREPVLPVLFIIITRCSVINPMPPTGVDDDDGNKLIIGYSVLTQDFEPRQ